MKIYTLLLFIIISSFNSFAQSNYDVFSFQEPLGYKKTIDKEYISFTKTNNSNGTYCIFSFYKNVINRDALQNVFNKNWSLLVEKAFATKSKPTIENLDDINGWKSITGNATFDFNGGKNAAMLFSFQKNGQVADLLILTNGNEYEKEITSLIESLQLKDIGSITENPKPNNEVTSKNNDLLGEWYLSDGNIKIALAFSGNGHFGRSFTSESAKPIALNLYQTTTWEGNGTYTINGNTLTLFPKNSAKEVYQIRYTLETLSEKQIKVLHLKRPNENGEMYESDYYFVK